MTDHSDSKYQPFYAINIGTGVSSSLFLSPDQAETLLGLLERALDSESVDGQRTIR